MRELVFCLEERSAQEMLNGILPKLDLDIPVRYLVFEGKQDLERQLPRKLKGYLNPQAQFVILRDQDAQPDCKVVKEKLADICRQAGKADSLVRIACRELESFYLADLAAVERGLGQTGLTRQQDRSKFRYPDSLSSPSRELSKLTGGLYQKVGGSRAIASHLDVENRRSPSFKNLIAGLRRLLHP